MPNDTSVCLGILVAIYLLLTPGRADGVNVTISTENGEMTGLREETAGGKAYYSMLGIPYADPPVGEGRFKNPRPLSQPLPERFDATAAGPMCPQWSITNTPGLQLEPLLGQEDCLYLNVYIPERGYQTGDKLPVMVWIYGGGFYFGYSEMYGPKKFMETEQVILVSFNYRVNAIGFMSFESDVVPGNMGMRDQVLALQWVQDHIEEFGGDKEAVTIFGESAGGMSVMRHLVSPKSQGLFSRAIAQSGASISWPLGEYQQRPLWYAERIAEYCGCNTMESQDSQLICLQQAPLEKIMNASRMFEKYSFAPVTYKPVVDDYSSDPFLPMTQNALYKTGRYNKVPLMLGSTRDEGSLFLVQILNHPSRLEYVNKHLHRELTLIMFGTNDGKMDDQIKVTLDEALDFYLPERQALYKYIHGIRDMTTDFVFISPVDMDAVFLMNVYDSPVYYYNYRHSSIHFSNANTYAYNHSKGELGTSHGDDLFALFDIYGIQGTEPDEAMSRKMVRLWVNFATREQPHKNWEPMDKSKGKRAQFAVLDLWPLRMAGPTEDNHKRIDFISKLLRRPRNNWSQNKAKEFDEYNFEDFY